jgi:hypothetical protein
MRFTEDQLKRAADLDVDLICTVVDRLRAGGSAQLEVLLVALVAAYAAGMHRSSVGWGIDRAWVPSQLAIELEETITEGGPYRQPPEGFVELVNELGGAAT